MSIIIVIILQSIKFQWTIITGITKPIIVSIQLIRISDERTVVDIVNDPVKVIITFARDLTLGNGH